jgi:general secretion pathway protein D
MKQRHTGLTFLCSSAAVFLAGCGSSNYEPSELHITKEKVAADAPKYADDVPRLVRRTAKLPSLEYSETQETFDVVVHNASVRDLLFALARDLGINVDIDARVSGIVSISAFDQTFTNILERISKQMPIRYEYVGDSILVKFDEPYMKQYVVEYLNIDRTYSSSASVAGVSTGGEGGGSGSASVSNTSSRSFWNQLEQTLRLLVDGSYSSNSSSEGLGDDVEDAITDAADNEPAIFSGLSPYFIVDQEAGMVLVFASEFTQKEVQAYLDSVQEISRRQVLLEATVVEVALDNSYSQGIDWSVFDPGATDGLFASGGTGILGPIRLDGSLPAGFPGTVLNEGNVRSLDNDGEFFGAAMRIGDLDVAVTMLQEFGEAKVVSSPRVNAMNNQGALMRVVDNRVFFTIEQEIEDGTDEEAPTITTEVTETIIPEGFTMNVLPQISSNGQVMLNLKPSLTRIVGPPRTIATTGATAESPNTSVREFESLITLRDGEVGVLGGFIEDRTDDGRQGVPGAMDIPGLGSFFQNNDEATRRTQLVIFIKATVINNPSINGDYVEYKDLLPDTNFMRRDQGNILFKPEQKEVD